MEINIDEVFDEIDENYNSLTPTGKKLANEIFDLFCKKLIDRDNSIECLKKPTITLSHLQKLLGCSRTTLYENITLKKLYDFLSIELVKENPYAKIQYQKEIISKVQNQLLKCYDRDIDIEKQQLEIDSLQLSIIEKTAEIERLHIRISKLTNKK